MFSMKCVQLFWIHEFCWMIQHKLNSARQFSISSQLVFATQLAQCLLPSQPSVCDLASLVLAQCWLPSQSSVGYLASLVLATQLAQCWLPSQPSVGYLASLVLATQLGQCWLPSQASVGYLASLVLASQLQSLPQVPTRSPTPGWEDAYRKETDEDRVRDRVILKREEKHNPIF